MRIGAVRRGQSRISWLACRAAPERCGWLSARVQRPDQDAAVELAREHGWTRLMVEVLIVDGGQWRRGCGMALLERAESWGRDKGAEVVRLGTYAHSAVAVGF